MPGTSRRGLFCVSRRATPGDVEDRRHIPCDAAVELIAGDAFQLRQNRLTILTSTDIRECRIQGGSLWGIEYQ